MDRGEPGLPCGSPGHLQRTGWAPRAAARATRVGGRGVADEVPGDVRHRAHRRPGRGRPASRWSSGLATTTRARAVPRQAARSSASVAASSPPTTATSRGPSTHASSAAIAWPEKRGCSATRGRAGQRPSAAVRCRVGPGERGVREQRRGDGAPARRLALSPRSCGRITSDSASSAVSKNPPVDVVAEPRERVVEQRACLRQPRVVARHLVHHEERVGDAAEVVEHRGGRAPATPSRERSSRPSSSRCSRSSSCAASTAAEIHCGSRGSRLPRRARRSRDRSRPRPPSRRARLRALVTPASRRRRTSSQPLRVVGLGSAAGARTYRCSNVPAVVTSSSSRGPCAVVVAEDVDELLRRPGRSALPRRPVSASSAEMNAPSRDRMSRRRIWRCRGRRAPATGSPGEPPPVRVDAGSRPLS